MPGMRIGSPALAAVLAVTAAGCEVDDGEPTAGDPVVTRTVTETATATDSAEDTPSVEPVVEEPTYVVTHVVDGDTVDLDSGDSVRLVGIDTPERGECGFGPAQSALKKLVLGKEVTLVESDEDADKYGRLLRYVEVGGQDAGLRLIRKGLAIARYDSRDGYSQASARGPLHQGRRGRGRRHLPEAEAEAEARGGAARLRRHRPGRQLLRARLRPLRPVLPARPRLRRRRPRHRHRVRPARAGR